MIFFEDWRTDNIRDLCDGRCFRSFHATISVDEDSDCKSLGYTKFEVQAIQNFLCKNCKHKQHQCFTCGKLGSSDMSKGAEIFEDKNNFLTTIMESSDALYAVVASLDTNLQLFCSYIPESTDEIILRCIRNATKLNTGVFPALPKFETLGESFLTRFLSISPLSAQAILFSGGTLVEYLEWSPECRIQAIGKFHVLEESISLFNTFCKFREIRDSKSAKTECSSIDSEVSSDKLQSQRKKEV